MKGTSKKGKTGKKANTGGIMKQPAAEMSPEIAMEDQIEVSPPRQAQGGAEY